MTTETKSNPANLMEWHSYKYTSKAHSARCLHCGGLLRLVGIHWQHTFKDDAGRCFNAVPDKGNSQ